VDGNIGALRFTGAAAEIDSVIEALDTPWEFSPDGAYLARCIGGMQPALSEAQRKRVDQLFADRGGYHRA